MFRLYFNYNLITVKKKFTDKKKYQGIVRKKSKIKEIQ